MANTWNPLAKNAGITLSPSERTATAISGSDTNNVRSRYIVPAGGGYAEWYSNIQNYTRFGICDDSFNPTTGHWRFSTHACGYVHVDGGVLKNNVQLGPIQTTSSGAVNCIAVNSTHFWIRKQNGYWNNSFSANPATGIGGMVHGLTGNIFLFASLGQTNDNLISSFAAANWTYSAPAGFTEFVDLPVDARISQQYVVVAHETDPPQNTVQARVSQQYIIVAHSPTAAPPGGTFKYHQPIINLDPLP